MACHASFAGADEPVAAMFADIEKGLDRAIFLHRHQHGFVPELMRDEIARLFQLAHPPADVPDFGPHMLPFARGEIFRPVTIPRDCIASGARQFGGWMGGITGQIIRRFGLGRHGLHSRVGA